MSDLTNYSEGVLVTAVPDALYVQLHTGDPGEDATANVATETTRQATTLGAHSGGVRTNTVNSVWLDVAAGETYSHVSLWDAETDGNPWGKKVLTAPVAVLAGDPFVINAGELTFALQ